MVDDPAPFFEFACHVTITITAEFLMKSRFNFIYHYLVFKELFILIYTVSAGRGAFGTTRSLIIITARLE